MSSKLDVVLGLQWGDEGKGKIVDVLAGRYPAVARFQGGPNAGHSLHFDGKSFGSARRLTLDISLGTQAEGIASRDGRNFFFTNEAFELAFVSRKAALQKIDLRGFMKKK